MSRIKVNNNNYMSIHNSTKTTHNHNQGLYYLYGKHTSTEALKNPRRKIKAIFCTPNFLSRHKSLIGQQAYTIKSITEIDNIIGAKVNHQGILLQSQILTEANIQNIDLSKQISLILLLDNIQDPANIGAIIRNAVAFGADAIIMTNKNAASENSTIARASAGAIEKVDLYSVPNLNQVITLLKKHHYWIVGLDGNTHKEIDTKYLGGKIALVLGSESRGIRHLTKKHCDYLFKIPIEKIESLNVSCASSIACYLYSISNKIS